jgi:hypothetical protein
MGRSMLRPYRFGKAVSEEIVRLWRGFRRG